jgi:ATP-dependent RNA helicase DeaD
MVEWRMNTFEQLGLSEISLESLRRKGFEEPTGIQEKIIPLVLQGDRDIIGQARTGTGKTAAFGLPILEKLLPRSKNIQALILTPTRELAVQVAEELNSLKGPRNIAILPVYGGQAIGPQIGRLRAGIDIVVGTPGRVIDHIERKTLDVSKISYLVLDEADEMLNMGFIDEVEKILESVGPGRRTLLFSATMPQPIRKVAEKYMGEYEMVVVEKSGSAVELTDQIYFEVHEGDKFEALCRIIDMEEEFYGLVFCRTKVGVDELAHRLVERSYAAEGLHGDITQVQRELILNRFRKRRITILVATDVAARGIDIINLSHVINFSLPGDMESYIHRIGRTGRAGSKGTAVTFVTPSEYRKLMYLQRMTKTEIRRERIPGVEDVIEAKRGRILSALQSIPEDDGRDDFLEMADSLLEDKEPVEVLASVLWYAFQEKLDRTKYRDIRKVRDVSVDRTGKSRLSIRLGKKDGATKRLLLDFFEREAGVPSRDIRDIEVLDKHSLVTVPFHYAEKILRTLTAKSGDKAPMVEILKEKPGVRPIRERSGPPWKRDGKPPGTFAGKKHRRYP